MPDSSIPDRKPSGACAPVLGFSEQTTKTKAGDLNGRRVVMKVTRKARETELKMVKVGDVLSSGGTLVKVHANGLITEKFYLTGGRVKVLSKEELCEKDQDIHDLAMKVLSAKSGDGSNYRVSQEALGLLSRETDFGDEVRTEIFKHSNFIVNKDNVEIYENDPFALIKLIKKEDRDNSPESGLKPLIYGFIEKLKEVDITETLDIIKTSRIDLSALEIIDILGRLDLNRNCTSGHKGEIESLNKKSEPASTPQPLVPEPVVSAPVAEPTPVVTPVVTPVAKPEQIAETQAQAYESISLGNPANDAVEGLENKTKGKDLRLALMGQMFLGHSISGTDLERFPEEDFIELLEAYNAGSSEDVWLEALCEGLEGLKANVKLLNEAINEDENSKKKERLKSIVSKVWDLKDGESILLPGGWKTSAGENSLIYQFKKNEDGTLDLTVYDSGISVGDRGSKGKQRVLPYRFYENINLDVLFDRGDGSSSIIMSLLQMRAYSGELQSELNRSHLYTVLAPLETYRNMEDDIDEDRFVTPARSGNTFWSCWKALARDRMVINQGAIGGGRKQYKENKLKMRVNFLVALHSRKPEDNLRYSKLLLESSRDVLRSLYKASKGAGTLSEEYENYKNAVLYIINQESKEGDKGVVSGAVSRIKPNESFKPFVASKMDLKASTSIVFPSLKYSDLVVEETSSAESNRVGSYALSSDRFEAFSRIISRMLENDSESDALIRDYMLDTPLTGDGFLEKWESSIVQEDRSEHLGLDGLPANLIARAMQASLLGPAALLHTFKYNIECLDASRKGFNPMVYILFEKLFFQTCNIKDVGVSPSEYMLGGISGSKQCLDFIKQGFKDFYVDGGIDSLNITTFLFFAYFAHKVRPDLNESCRDDGLYKKIEGYLADCLERKNISLEERAALHKFRIYLYSTKQEESLSSDDYKEIAFSLAFYKNYHPPVESKMLAEMRNLDIDEKVKSFLDKIRSKLNCDVDSEFLNKLFLDLDLDCKGAALDWKSSGGNWRLELDEGKFWEIDLATGSISNENGIWDGPFNQEWESRGVFVEIFGDSQGKIEYHIDDNGLVSFEALEGHQFRVLGCSGVKNKDLNPSHFKENLQMKIGEKWYSFGGSDSYKGAIEKLFPEAFIGRHDFWCNSEDNSIYIMNKGSLESIACLYLREGEENYSLSPVNSDGSIDIEKSLRLHSEGVLESILDRFSGGDDMEAVMSGDQMEELNIKGFQSKKNKPLLFSLGSSGDSFSWNEDSSYHLVEQQDDIIPGFSSYLLLQSETKKKLLIPCLPFKPTSAFSDESRLASSGLNGNKGDPKLLFEYDLLDGKLKPKSSEGNLFAAYIYLFQRDYRSALNYIKELSLCDDLSDKSLEIIMMIIEGISDLNKDNSPSCVAVKLRLLHRVLNNISSKGKSKTNAGFKQKVIDQVRYLTGLYIQSINNVDASLRLDEASLDAYGFLGRETSEEVTEESPSSRPRDAQTIGYKGGVEYNRAILPRLSGYIIAEIDSADELIKLGRRTDFSYKGTLNKLGFGLGEESYVEEASLFLPSLYASKDFFAKSMDILTGNDDQKRQALMYNLQVMANMPKPKYETIDIKIIYLLIHVGFSHQEWNETKLSDIDELQYTNGDRDIDIEIFRIYKKICESYGQVGYDSSEYIFRMPASDGASSQRVPIKDLFTSDEIEGFGLKRDQLRVRNKAPEELVCDGLSAVDRINLSVVIESAFEEIHSTTCDISSFSSISGSGEDSPFSKAITAEREVLQEALVSGAEALKAEKRYKLKEDEDLSAYKSDWQSERARLELEAETIRESFLNKLNQVGSLGRVAMKGQLFAEITLADAIRLFLRGDQNQFAELNPTLKSEEIKTLYKEIAHFLILKTKSQKYSRLLDHVTKLDTSKEGERSGLIQSLVRELEATRHYEPNENPDLLVFEYFSDINLRKGQVVMIRDLLAINSDDDRYESRVAQMIMGGGKTSVLAVIIAMHSAKFGRLPCFITTGAQYGSVKMNLSRSMKECFNMDVVALDFDRQELGDIVNLQNIELHLKNASELGRLVLMKREFLQSVMLEFQSLSRSYKESLPDAGLIERRIKALGNILKFIKEKGDAIIDEVDQVLLSNQEVNFPDGEAKAIPKERLHLMGEIYKLLCSEHEITLNDGTTHSINDLVGLRSSGGARKSLSKEYYKNHIVPYIAQELAKTKFDGLDSEFSDALLSYLEGDNSNEEFLAELKRLNASEGAGDRELAKLISLAKYAINDLLPQCLAKDANRHFGRSGRAGSSAKVVPYLAVGTPSTTEFASEFEAAAYHFQTVLQSGVTVEHIRVFAEVSQQEAMREAEEKKCAITETESYKKFEKITLVSLFDYLQGRTDVEHIANEINKKASVELLVRLESILAENQIRYYPERLTSNAQYFSALFGTIRAWTGTPWNIRGYCSSLKKDPKLAAEIEGKILARLSVLENSDKKNKFIHEIDTIDPSEFLGEALEGHRDPKNVRGLMDPAGTFKKSQNIDVARAMLEKMSDVKGVLFFYKKPGESIANELYILRRVEGDPKGSIERIGGTSIKNIKEVTGLDPSEYAVFYDEMHTTGTDIKQDPKAINLMTVDRKMLLRTFMQSSLRLRGLFDDQRVELVISGNDRAGMVNSGRTLSDIVQTLATNQAIKISEDVYASYRQKIFHVFKRYAEERLLHEEGVSEKAAVSKAFEAFLVLVKNDDPYVMFNGKMEEKDTIEVLEALAVSYIRQMESLNVVSKDDIGNLKQEYQAIIEEAREEIMRPEHVMLSSAVESDSGVGREQVVEVKQETELEIALEQELSVKLPKAGPKPHVIAFQEKRTDFEALLSGRLSGVGYDSQLGVARVRSIGESIRAIEEEEYVGLFGEDIFVTENFEHTIRKRLSVFDRRQRPAEQILVVKDSEGNFKFNILSLSEAELISPHLHGKKDAWLVNSDGVLLGSSTTSFPFSEEKVQEALLQVNIFNGNAIYLSRHMGSLQRWLDGSKNKRALIFKFLDSKAKMDRTGRQSLLLTALEQSIDIPVEESLIISSEEYVDAGQVALSPAFIADVARRKLGIAYNSFIDTLEVTLDELCESKEARVELEMKLMNLMADFLNQKTIASLDSTVIKLMEFLETVATLDHEKKNNMEAFFKANLSDLHKRCKDTRTEASFTSNGASEVYPDIDRHITGQGIPRSLYCYFRIKSSYAPALICGDVVVAREKVVLDSVERNYTDKEMIKGMAPKGYLKAIYSKDGRFEGFSVLGRSVRGSCSFDVSPMAFSSLSEDVKRIVDGFFSMRRVDGVMNGLEESTRVRFKEEFYEAIGASGKKRFNELKGRESERSKGRLEKRIPELVIKRRVLEVLVSFLNRDYTAIIDIAKEKGLEEGETDVLEELARSLDSYGSYNLNEVFKLIIRSFEDSSDKVNIKKLGKTHADQERTGALLKQMERGASVVFKVLLSILEEYDIECEIGSANELFAQLLPDLIKMACLTKSLDIKLLFPAQGCIYEEDDNKYEVIYSPYPQIEIYDKLSFFGGHQTSRDHFVRDLSPSD